MTIPRQLVLPLLALPWLVAITSLAFLAAPRFPLSGVFVADSRMDGKSPYVFTFLPAERVSKPGEQSDGWIGQRILADPVYGGARIPGPYEQAEVVIEYRPVRQTLLEFGRVHDLNKTQLELSPMYSSELNAAPHLIRLAPPQAIGVDTRTTAVWFASTTSPSLSDDELPETTYALSLRGTHDFYVVPAGGKIDVEFHFQNVNRKKGSDAVVIRVFRGEEELNERVFVQSVSNEPRMGVVSSHRVRIVPAAPGVYHIAFVASDDVFLRSITTSNRRWVVGPRLYLGDTVGYLEKRFPRIWVTTARHLVAQTFHTEGLQTIQFGEKSVKLRRTHATVRGDRSDAIASPVTIGIPKGDARLVLDGYAALSRDAFFEPKPRRLTDATRLADEGIRMVVTPYQPPEQLGNGWFRSRFHYRLTPDQDELRIVLSAPGIAERFGSVDIRRMTVTYRRPVKQLTDWIAIIRHEFANARRRN